MKTDGAQEILIRNARVWHSVQSELTEKGSVLIRGGRIAKVGRFHARAETVIDAGGALVMPGLVQGHVHLCQTLFRGLAEDVPLLPWLRKYVWPLEAAHDEDSIRVSAQLACAEMIRGGVTSFLSFETVRLTGAVFEAVAEAGLMGVISHVLMDESCGYAPLATDVEDSLADCDILIEQWGKHDSLRPAVAPRFALACTPRNMRLAAEYARDHNLLLHTHASEQKAEVEEVRRRTGLSNIEFLHKAGMTGADVCLAHCVHISEREGQILQETGTRVLHCPSANLKLGSGIAPVPEYLKAGIPVALGSDGAPCNNRLDMFAEMRTAATLQKIRLGPDALPAADVARMATEGGAVALGWEEQIGILAEGYRANLILVDFDSLHALPSEEPATNVVYSFGPDDVLMTIVNGRILYEDGHLTTIDEENLKAEAREQRRQLLKRANL